MFFFDCAGERVLNEIVRPKLISGQGTSIAAQARDFLLETAMEVVHLFFLELPLWKRRAMRSGPSEPKQIRMRSAAPYVGPESSSLAIAGGIALTIANIHGRPCSPVRDHRLFGNAWRDMVCQPLSQRHRRCTRSHRRNRQL